MRMATVKLQASDGEIFIVDLKIMAAFGIVRDLLKMQGEVIRLPIMDSFTLKNILQWVKYHFEHSKLDERTIQWEYDFFEKYRPKILQLILAANLLKIPRMVNVGCSYISDMQSKIGLDSSDTIQKSSQGSSADGH